jgi:hypothetical protein
MLENATAKLEDLLKREVDLEFGTQTQKASCFSLLFVFVKL